MSDLMDSRAMELLYRERAKVEPEHSIKWLGQAERWGELARHESAWRLQRRNTQQQMHTGPMTTQPKTASDRRWKQMG
jgi:hypothetical protein